MLIRKGIIFFVFASIVFISGCNENPVESVSKKDDSATPATLVQTGAQEEVTEINLALFPWVPRMQQFEDVITAAWAEIEPDVEINYQFYDCYSELPSDNLHVFVYDALWLDYLVAQNALAEIPPNKINHKGDILPFARRGARKNGKIYGIPQIGCSSVFFYRDSDAALKRARGLDDIYNVIGDHTWNTPQLPPGEGLLASVGGWSFLKYIDAYMSERNRYDVNPPLPDPSNLNPDLLSSVQKLLLMAGEEQALHWEPNPPYFRAAWFAEGQGRAMINYSESMVSMDGFEHQVDMRILPMADRDRIDLFYVDMVGINTTVMNSQNPRLVNLALKLSNLITRSDVLIDIFGTQNNTYTKPQYLLPVHRSVCAALRQQSPIYNEMRRLIHPGRAHTFRAGAELKDWIDQNITAFQDEVFDLPQSSFVQQLDRFTIPAFYCK